MNELRIYLNSLSLDEQKDFATKCGTSIGYLRKALSKNHELGAALCVLIEKASSGEVTRKHLHPSDWTCIWPELQAA
ncbi:YdaS family helix-turn-helix protein [Pantoea sp. NGS-ED-1003]|uniref:transcriptional regulator n=1 Tax=Pantoea sp. NGS-ED-1003 TaxID=1526743 RepID=UPI0005357DBD|nr:YdaS family helix-turn-helix protein [Pantoea sp. NGS-ED-1003]